MKVKKLIELLETKDPNAEVGIICYEYASNEDSCGYDVDYDIEGIKIDEGNVVRLHTGHAFDLEK